MPLTRGKVLGYDLERLAFRFSMLNDSETVECQISDAAMDELAGVKGTLSTARQAQFLAHRDAIEQIASDLFDAGPSIKSAASGYSPSTFRNRSRAGSAAVALLSAHTQSPKAANAIKNSATQANVELQS